MALFDAVTADDMRTAQIVSGVTMALFIGVGLAPGLRQHAVKLRAWLLAGYLAGCALFVAYVLLR